MLTVALAEVDGLARAARDLGNCIGEGFLARVLRARLLAARFDDHAWTALRDVELLHFLEVLGGVEQVDLQLVRLLLVLPQPLVELRVLGIGRRVERDDPDLVLQPLENPGRLIGERVDFVLRRVPGFRLLHGEIIEAGEHRDHERAGDHAAGEEESAAARKPVAHPADVHPQVCGNPQNADDDLHPGPGVLDPGAHEHARVDRGEERGNPENPQDAGKPVTGRVSRGHGSAPAVRLDRPVAGKQADRADREEIDGVLQFDGASAERVEVRDGAQVGDELAGRALRLGRRPADDPGHEQDDESDQRRDSLVFREARDEQSQRHVRGAEQEEPRVSEEDAAPFDAALVAGDELNGCGVDQRQRQRADEDREGRQDSQRHVGPSAGGVSSVPRRS